MKIGLDGRCLNTTHIRGMGKALFELLREAAGHEDVSFAIMGDRPRLPIHYPRGSKVDAWAWRIRGDRFRVWEQLALPRRAHLLSCDILHCCGTTCPYWQPVPTVVTIHDMLPWVEEAPGVYRDWVLPAAYRRAKAIITVSENSRRDILARWPELAGKIEVIRWGIHPRYLGSSFPPLNQKLITLGVKQPYLLYFGGELARKRLDWAIDVWKGLAMPEVRLVVCGLAQPDVARRERVPPELAERFVCLGYVPEDCLPSLYAEAAGVLYPTLYEGFGFPVLESQAVGTPVLMSAVGSLQELIGPGAVVLPPHDLDAWISACDKVLRGETLVGTSSRAWAAGFSWKEAFERTLGVYRAVLSSGSL